MRNFLTHLQQAVDDHRWTVALRDVQKITAQYRSQLAQAEAETIQEIAVLALQIFAASDFQTRWQMAKLFPELGQAAIAPLIAILKDEEADLEERWFIARILGEFKSNAALEALIAVVDEQQNPELNEIAIAALANFGTAAIPPLTTLLQQPSFSLFATTALAQIRHADTLEPLLQQASHADPSARATAIAALENFRDPRILPVLRTAVRDVAAIVRKEAAIAIGVWGARSPELDVIADLQPLLYDFNLEVCQQAAIALGRIGTPEAAMPLWTALIAPATPIPLQLELARALAWMETPTRLDYLQQALDRVPPETAAAIIKLLGRFKTPQLRPLAARGLLDFFQRYPQLDIAIAQALAQALGYLGDRAAIPALKQLQQSPSITVQLHAIAALKHFPEAC